MGSSLTPPQYLKRGPKWLRAKFNALVDYATATTPLPGDNVSAQDGPNGRMLSASAGDTSATIENVVLTVDGIPYSGCKLKGNLGPQIT